MKLGFFFWFIESIKRINDCLHIKDDQKKLSVDKEANIERKWSLAADSIIKSALTGGKRFYWVHLLPSFPRIRRLRSHRRRIGYPSYH